MNTSNNSPRTIFNEALEIEGARQRAEYLAKVCGSDAALRQKLSTGAGQVYNEKFTPEIMAEKYRVLYRMFQ